jgi:hypothetical protein
MIAVDFFSFEFYNEKFIIYLADGPMRNQPLYVPIRRVCEAMGLAFGPQLRRIKRNPTLEEALVELDITRLTENGEEGQWGGVRRPISALWLKRLPYWLGTLDPNRVKSEIQEKVILYQRELADVAWSAFRSEILPADILAEMDAHLPPEQRAYQQIMDEATAIRLSLDDHGSKLDDLTERVSGLEARFVGKDFINEQQQHQYLRMVNTLGELLKKKKAGNQAIIHNEVKKHFQVPAYQLLSEDIYPDVVAYLRQWWQHIAPDEPLPSAFRSGDQRRLF